MKEESKWEHISTAVMTKIKSNQIAETPINWEGKQPLRDLRLKSFHFGERFRESRSHRARVRVCRRRRRRRGGGGGWRRRWRWYSTSMTSLIVAQRRRTTPLFRSTRSSRTVLASVAFSTALCRSFSLYKSVCFYLYAWLPIVLNF